MTLDLKKIDETRNNLLEEITHNYLISEKHKKVYKAFTYFVHFLIFISAVSIFAFASLVGIATGRG